MATAKTRSASRLLGLSLRPRTGHAAHIKIHPRPRNLAESRQILQVLQEYGRAVMYNTYVQALKFGKSLNRRKSACLRTREKIGSAFATACPNFNATTADVANDENLKQGEEHRTKDDSRARELVTEAISSPRTGAISQLAVAEPIPERNLLSQTSP